MNKTRRIDILNIGLVALSLLIAFKLPFKLFLFSYAVLGPLHYLTEINWLNDRNFFSKANRKWSAAFLVLTLLISTYPILKLFHLEETPFLRGLVKFTSENSSAFILAALLFAIGYVVIRRGSYIIAALMAAIIVSLLASTMFPEAFLLVGVFVPTLVHVYVFTWLFILYGARRARSRYGYLLAAIVFLVPFFIFMVPYDSSAYVIDGKTYDTFIDTNMYLITSTIQKVLGNTPADGFDLQSEFAMRSQVFIAFAYTYHYVNWFSKTSIIGWGKSLSRSKALKILAIWALAVGFYLYDYKLGFTALFFLSFLHVLLEFPLNIVTIKALGQGLKTA